MRRVVLALSIMVCAALPAPAQQMRDPDIEAVIQRQLDAFVADDVEGAFGFASPTIRGAFGTAERFGEMVRNRYPMVWRPDRVRFLELREVAGGLWQRVMITDAEGALHFVDYQMVRTEDAWEINAVGLFEADSTGI